MKCAIEWLQLILNMNTFDDKIQNQIYGCGSETNDSELMLGARNNFIRKVYAILGLQLLVTCGFVMLSTFNIAFQQFQDQNTALFWIALITSVVSLLILGCVSGAATKSPYNILLLSIFTLAESYLVSLICSLYTPESVLNAAVATLGATVGLTFFAIYTKSDFTDSYSKCYAFFWSFFGISLFLTMVNIFIFRSSFLTILIAIAIGAVYSLYLIIDTQLILGGKNKQLTLDNYVLGAVLLYIDIVQLFLQLLKIFGERR